MDYQLNSDIFLNEKFKKKKTTKYVSGKMFTSRLGRLFR